MVTQLFSFASKRFKLRVDVILGDVESIHRDILV